MKTLYESLHLVDTLKPDEPAAASESFPELSVQDFCRGVLTSFEYRESLYHRVRLGTLPPAIELMMYARAYGPVTEKVEHTGKDGQPIETITEVRRVIVRSSLDFDEQQEEKKPVTH